MSEGESLRVSWDGALATRKVLARVHSRTVRKQKLFPKPYQTDLATFAILLLYFHSSPQP